MSFKHIIISRVNIPRELDPSKYDNPALYKDPEWNKKRIELLNKYTRSSLRKQTCQDFEFITLWGKHHPVPTYQRLPNERMWYVRRGVDEYDEKPFDFKQWKKNPKKCEKTEMDFAFQIRDLVRQHYKPPILITNLDSDDCLRHDFVEILQYNAKNKLAQREVPLIIDACTRYLMHTETGGRGEKARRTPSPATSSLEVGEIECYPLRWHHSMMLDYLPKGIDYIRINDLLMMQTVSGANILTRGKGKDANFNPKEFY